MFYEINCWLATSSATHLSSQTAQCKSGHRIVVFGIVAFVPYARFYCRIGACKSLANMHTTTKKLFAASGTR